MDPTNEKRKADAPTMAPPSKTARITTTTTEPPADPPDNKEPSTGDDSQELNKLVATSESMKDDELSVDEGKTKETTSLPETIVTEKPEEAVNEANKAINKGPEGPKQAISEEPKRPLRKK